MKQSCLTFFKYFTPRSDVMIINFNYFFNPWYYLKCDEQPVNH